MTQFVLQNICQSPSCANDCDCIPWIKSEHA